MSVNDFKLLSRICSPSDVRNLTLSQLPALCDELRAYIVEECSVNPGHLGSSLGVVELTVALHYVFSSPNDKIVWDVGHQAYGHKILTGRGVVFCTNRKLGGLRPFPSPAESEHDAFICGHASNSISAALGLSVGLHRRCAEDGSEEPNVVVVIGDGSMGGGLAFEGLNNVSGLDNDMLIILNDNDMSIDRSVGGFRKLLVGLNTGRGYNRFRAMVSRRLRGGRFYRARRGRAIRFGNALKSVLSGVQNMFEGMNIRYFGPFDGHDVIGLVETLGRIKDMRGPKLLHLHTVKGKGYGPAERGGSVWHAPGRFDVSTGVRKDVPSGDDCVRYQDVFGHTLTELCGMNSRIVGVTPAMLSGCGMNIVAKSFPERVFDVGIAEGHAVTFSAGMAKEGLLPFCNIYSSFSQRAYDNIIHDVAILGLDVVICLDRAGLVGEDGVTHHGVFDIAALRCIPGLTLCSPMNEHELRHLMYTAQAHPSGCWVIRYPRGKGVLKEWRCDFESVAVGSGRKLRDGKDIAVLSLGPVGNVVSQAIEDVEKAYGDISIAHYDMRFVKPLDEKLMEDVACRFKKVITIEDGCRQGGFGSAVLEWLNEHHYSVGVCRMGLPDFFVEHGKVEELHRLAGIDKEGIVEKICELTS